MRFLLRAGFDVTFSSQSVQLVARLIAQSKRQSQSYAALQNPYLVKHSE